LEPGGGPSAVRPSYYALRPYGRWPRSGYIGRMTARQFRACLKKADVSQRRFALWLGFDVGTVNRWAKGRREIPRYAAVLAELLVKHPNLRQYPLAEKTD